MTAIRIAGADVAFEAATGQDVLSAALQAGIDLPYSCRKGVCGNCAGSIAEGQVQPLPGTTLEHPACAPGEVLLCRATPIGEVTLAPRHWQRAEAGARRRLTAKVFRNTRAAPDVSILQLRLPAGKRAKFRAGQYLQIVLPDGSERSYSMANPPQESDGVTLHIRHVAGGRFTAMVPDLVPGDPVEIVLPFGSVGLAVDDTRPLVCVAGGTGFAPIKSILDDLARRVDSRAVTLLWGARNDAGLYLLPAVQTWQTRLSAFRFVPAVSDATSALPDAFAGRLPDALAAAVPDLRGHVLYCCGAPGLVQATRERALALGLGPEDFHADAFVRGGAA